MRAFDRVTKTLGVLMVGVVGPLAGQDGNLHVCIINQSSFESVRIRLCSDHDGRCWGEMVLEAGARQVYSDTGIQRTTTRAGTLDINGGLQDSSVLDIYGTGGWRYDVGFNWAGSGDNGNLSNWDWVCGLRRYVISSGGTVSGPFTGR